MDTIKAYQVQDKRSDRKRKVIKDEPLQQLINSIKQHGVLMPILLDEDKRLIAGERRLRACLSLDENYEIPYITKPQLTEDDKIIIELEENIRRDDMIWQDVYLARLSLISIYRTKGFALPEIYAGLGISKSVYDNIVLLNKFVVEKEDLSILEYPSMRAAVAKVTRIREREKNRELSEILDVATQSTELEDGELVEVVDENTSVVQMATKDKNRSDYKRGNFDIRHGNILELFQKTWERKFDFVHCDFPYGVNHGESGQGGTKDGSWTGYDDDEQTYFDLIKGLCAARNKIMYPSAHLMFWFSMKYYKETIQLFDELAPDLKPNLHPLIWHKSDNKGIISNVKHTPRNVYETALIFTRGGRQIVNITNNVYSCPSYKSKALHVSEKPETMLEGFFKMFVDEYTEVLDPTCGGGSAIRAAFSAGAKRALGVELNPEFSKLAEDALDQKIKLENFTTKYKL